MSGEGGTFRLLQPGLMSVDELNEILSQVMDFACCPIL